MTKREFKKLLKPLADAEGLILNGGLAYQSYHQNGFYMLCGILLQPSGFCKDEFYCMSVSYCPFIPSNPPGVFVLSVSKEIGKTWTKSMFESNQTYIIEQFKTFQRNNDSIKKLYENQLEIDHIYWGVELRRYEYLCYLSIVLGKYDQAVKFAKMVIAEQYDNEPAFITELKHQAVQIIKYIQNGEIDRLVELLTSYQTANLNALKLKVRKDNI